MDPRANPKPSTNVRDDGKSAHAHAHATEHANPPAEEAIPQLDDLRERADELLGRAASFIRSYPGTSLLLAAAMGYLVGRIVRA